MPAFKITKNGIDRFKNFKDLAEATTYAASLGVGFGVVFSSTGDLPTPDRKEKLAHDLAFGGYLIRQFLDKNRELKASPEQSALFLQRFSVIKAFIELGAIPEALPMLIAFDNEGLEVIYPDSRKELDVLRIESYLDSL